MTKAQEIEILNETIRTLGDESYIGPWLKSVLASVESDVRNDFHPQATIADTRKEIAEMKAKAQREIDSLRLAALNEIANEQGKFQTRRDAAIQSIFDAAHKIEKLAENL